MRRFIENPGDMVEVLGDMFPRLKHGNADGTGSNLQILQGDMQILEWFQGFQQIIDFIFTGCGLPPQNKAQVEQTATEIQTKNSLASETMKLLKQLRIDQGSRVHDKALIIYGLGDGKGKIPFTLSIPEEENKDKEKEIEEAKIKIEANLSNYITEISKLYSVNKQEAKNILKENIKVNSEVFEDTKHMQLEQQEEEEGGKKDDSKGTN